MSGLRNAHDVAIIGAGLIGLSVAKALMERYLGLPLLVADKEQDVAQHQSVHNSVLSTLVCTTSLARSR